MLQTFAYSWNRADLRVHAPLDALTVDPEHPVSWRAVEHVAPPTRLLASPGGAALFHGSGSVVETAREAIDALLAPPGDIVLLSRVQGAGDVSFVTFEQRFDGHRVVLGRITVAVDATGAVRALRVGELAPRGPRERPEVTPRLERFSTGAGARGALEDLLEQAPADLRAMDVPTVERVWIATNDGVRAAWRADVVSHDRRQQADYYLDAESGGLLRREPRVFNAVAGARTWPTDPTAPSVMVSFPTAESPTHASPRGWTAARQTIGNNVHAYLNWGEDFTYGGTVADAVGEPPMLDFPYTGDTLADGNAALTNAFWVLNDAHDRFRLLGFDEASGALQEDSFGRGGVGDDLTWALVQYESVDGTQATGDVFSGFGPDGDAGWIAIGLFDVEGEIRDAAFETDLLIHEYTHGVTTRMVGNDAACLNAQQSRAISEGWSDFFAASFTNDPVIGAWTSGDPNNGHRSAPLDRIAFTITQFCIPDCDVERNGEIWSAVLWDLRNGYLTEHGPEGAEMVERLVVESLRYVPCRPTFADARDALILADLALTGGTNYCTIWAAAQGRGIGVNIMTTGPDDQFPIAGFAMPEGCTGGADVSFDRLDYDLAATATIRVVEPGGPATGVVTITTVSGDSEDVDVVVETGVAKLASIVLTADAPTPGDGILQVTDGDVLTAVYGVGGPEAQATATGTMDVRISDHAFWGDCRDTPGWADDDHDDTPGWWILPGFLDAGEAGTYYVDLANFTSAPLIGATVQVESLHPGLTVLPSTPMEIGTVPAAANGTGRVVEIAFVANAEPGLPGREPAAVRLHVESQGRSGTVDLDLTLNADYLVSASLSPFNGGVEDFEAGSRTRDLWLTQDDPAGLNEWRRVDCAGVGGGSGFANAAADCSSYADGQFGSALISPRIFLPLTADDVAFRINNLSWHNDIDLYTDPGNPYCEADVVSVYAVGDPGTFPVDNPTLPGAQRQYVFNDNGAHFSSGPYYVDTGPRFLDPGAGWDQLRLAWIFWSHVFDCDLETTNTGHYFLDDVRWDYDLVTEVPETTPCSQDCLALVNLVVDPPGPHCPGTEVTLTAVTELSDCEGEVRYAFSGPGVPDEAGWTLETSTTGVAADGEEWGIYIQCQTDTACAASRGVSIQSPGGDGFGTTIPETLRIAKQGDDARLDWLGLAVPPSYGVFRATSREELVAGPETWEVLLRVDEEGPGGEGMAMMSLERPPGVTIEYLKVLGRDRCTDVPRLP
ncbi:MAG: M36 family metallopeptidase [Acidobacteriota bacterium]